MVVQADDVVALSVKTTLERMVLVAEGKRAVLLHDFFELAAVLVERAKIDIGRQLDVARVGCLARLADLGQQLIDGADLNRMAVGVVGPCLLRHGRTCGQRHGAHRQRP